MKISNLVHTTCLGVENSLKNFYHLYNIDHCSLYIWWVSMCYHSYFQWGDTAVLAVAMCVLESPRRLYLT
jgi:hypothetical protein